MEDGEGDVSSEAARREVLPVPAVKRSVILMVLSEVDGGDGVVEVRVKAAVSVSIWRSGLEVICCARRAVCWKDGGVMAIEGSFQVLCERWWYVGVLGERR